MHKTVKDCLCVHIFLEILNKMFATKFFFNIVKFTAGIACQNDAIGLYAQNVSQGNVTTM